MVLLALPLADLDWLAGKVVALGRKYATGTSEYSASNPRRR
jgi:hypothetical protein